MQQPHMSGGVGLYEKEWLCDPECPMDEDCLYLNVWTPAMTGRERYPVLVWYFGGGLMMGAPNEMEFDGERLARRGIVVVTVNYRTNVFGFLAHPELTREAPDAPTNFGHLTSNAPLAGTAEYRGLWRRSRAYHHCGTVCGRRKRPGTADIAAERRLVPVCDH